MADSVPVGVGGERRFREGLSWRLELVRSLAGPPPLVNIFNLLHYHGLLLLDKETKQKPANLGRDYGDRFLFCADTP